MAKHHPLFCAACRVMVLVPEVRGPFGGISYVVPGDPWVKAHSRDGYPIWFCSAECHEKGEAKPVRALMPGEARKHRSTTPDPPVVVASSLKPRRAPNLEFASDDDTLMWLIEQWEKEAMSGNEPGISTDEAKRIVSTKTAPRITEESIKARIGATTFHHIDQLTICVITMVNGFHVVGKAAPASAANFDEKVGERYAYDDAFKQLWPLEGYLLRDRLDAEARAAHEAEGAVERLNQTTAKT